MKTRTFSRELRWRLYDTFMLCMLIAVYIISLIILTRIPIWW